MSEILYDIVNFVFFPLKIFLHHDAVEKIGLRSLRQERSRACARELKRPFLDIGCGNNDLVAQEGKYSGVGIDIAAPKTRPDVFACAERLPFKDDSFNAASYVVSLRYVGDVPAAMREAHRVLRAGGRIVILENPPFENWLRHHLTFWTKVEGERIVGFTQADIKNLFTQAHFLFVARRRYLYGLGVIYVGEKAR
jgi:ubiquinone/menaquinone biosynthesis C-methylase UbiE